MKFNFKYINHVWTFNRISTAIRNDAVVKNTAIPNEHNQAVIEETGSSILSGLKDVAAGGSFGDLAGMLTGKTPIDMNNPMIKELAGKVTGNLGSKFGLSTEVADGVANGLTSQVLSGLVNKANDPSDGSFQISDLVNAISGGSNSGLMDAVSKYGGQFGLDQDGDGQVGMNDAIAAMSKNSGGIGGLLGKLFGK